MVYYTVTNYMDHDQLMTAGGKGRDDYFEVLRRMGLECIRIPTVRKSRRISALRRISMEKELRRAWERETSHLGNGDVIVLHSPLAEKFLGYTDVLRGLKEKGVTIVDIVFDLETFFLSDYKKAARVKHYIDKRTEAEIFSLSDVIVAHNERMKDRLISIGTPRSKIVCVGVMDYLRDGEITDNTDGRFGIDKPVVFCSNLAETKSGFAYRLGDDFRIDLYGPDFGGRTSSSVRYRGAYPSFELMDIMEGSFGLVWDGTSSVTCEGACGDYLRYNNPHKMSHYLAGGMPVMIWKEAALAEFVKKEGCGVLIDSLPEIPERLRSISAEEYETMRKNAVRTGTEMRKGAHIRRAVEAALRKAGADNF